MALSLYGQQAIPSLYKGVNLPVDDLRFDLLIHLVTQQTGIKFSLNTQKFRPSRIIHVPGGKLSVGEVLSVIRKTTGIHYTVLGEHIIFIDGPPRKIVVDTRKRVDNDPPVSQAQFAGILYPISLSSTRGYLLKDSIHGTIIDRPIIVANKTQRSPTRAGFFAEAGLAVDETLYINPSVQAGWPFLYGIVQWSSNFNVSGIRYGAGGSLRLSDRWRLGLMATTGANSKYYPRGMAGLPMTVKTSLQKMGILAQTEFGEHIRLQFGAVLNILSTKYFNALGQSMPVLSEPNANEYIKPPYTIQDTFSPLSNQNTKTWIGLQASLFYSINFQRSR